MKAGDVYFEKSTKSKQNICKVVDLSKYGGLYVPHLTKDVVGLLHRVKSDRRSAIGKSRPPYVWEVHLEGEPRQRFYDEAKAKEWVSAVLKLG